MTIKDRYGNLVGRVDENGSTKVAKDRYGNLVGKYDSNTGKTTDRYGNTVAYGDVLGGMIR